MKAEVAKFKEKLDQHFNNEMALFQEIDASNITALERKELFDHMLTHAHYKQNVKPNMASLSRILKDLQRKESDCTKENPCCDRRGEYNGFASGPLSFVCPKHCSCHD